MKPMFFISVFALILGMQTTAHALPIHSTVKQEEMSFLSSMSDAYDFEGIVKLDNCSGSLVRFEHSKDSDLAMVMSNGHCVSTGPFGGFIKPGQALVNKPAKRAFRFLNTNG